MDVLIVATTRFSPYLSRGLPARDVSLRIVARALFDELGSDPGLRHPSPTRLLRSLMVVQISDRIKAVDWVPCLGFAKFGHR